MTIADFDQVTAGWVVFPKKTITFLWGFQPSDNYNLVSHVSRVNSKLSHSDF